MSIEDALVDYYHVLGVAPGASWQDLKNAYRRRSKECHPDMGGTHERFVELNKAWAVLSDPVSRQAYDALRAAPKDPDAIIRWEPAAARADAQAAHVTSEYEANWAQFRNWVDGIAADVAQAQYGRETKLGIDLPTAGNSWTGGWAIALGMAPGMICLIRVLASYGSPGSSWNTTAGGVVGSAILIKGGAWAGKWVHKKIRDAILTQKAERVVFECPRCAQKLRIPKISNRFTVTCGVCEAKMSVDVSKQGMYVLPDCPHCGHSGKWDGIQCGHCNFKQARMASASILEKRKHRLQRGAQRKDEPWKEAKGCATVVVVLGSFVLFAGVISWVISHYFPGVEKWLDGNGAIFRYLQLFRHLRGH
jgi:hypothetical protein